MRNDVRAVAFDLDGTLIDTLPDLAAAGNRMLAGFDKTPLSEAQVRDFIGDGIAVLARRMLTNHRDLQPDAQALESAVDAFKVAYAEELTARSRPYPGVMEGLAALSGRLPLACVTNKSMAYTEPLLEATGMRHYFQLVIGGDTLARKKPDPEPFLHCARTLDVPPAHLLVVGDSANDCKAARAAGCPVVCVPYGYCGPEGVRGLDCDAIVMNVFTLATSLLNTKS